jgi:hypothetical protein
MALSAQTGMHVIVELITVSGESENLEFDIVPEHLADFASGYLSESTPLARTIWKKPAGAVLPYRQGDIVRLRILSVKASEATPSAESAQQREAAARKAVADIERTNAINFASSFSGKWGDYDPSGVERWAEDDKAKRQNSDD